MLFFKKQNIQLMPGAPPASPDPLVGGGTVGRVDWDRLLGCLLPAQWDSWSPLGVVWIDGLQGWSLGLKLSWES